MAFFLRAISLVENIFQIYLGWVEKHTKMAIFKTSKADALNGLKSHIVNILGIVSLLQPVNSAKAATDNM